MGRSERGGEGNWAFLDYFSSLKILYRFLIRGKINRQRHLTFNNFFYNSILFDWSCPWESTNTLSPFVSIFFFSFLFISWYFLQWLQNVFKKFKRMHGVVHPVYKWCTGHPLSIRKFYLWKSSGYYRCTTVLKKLN